MCTGKCSDCDFYYVCLELLLSDSNALNELYKELTVKLASVLVKYREQRIALASEED